MHPEFSVRCITHSHLLVVLWLHSSVDPPDSQWGPAVERVIEARRASKVTLRDTRQLVISDGGAPNTTQRQRFFRDFSAGLPSKVAVLTSALSNPVKRGVATALLWLNPAVRFYEPPAFEEALAYLDLTGSGAAIWSTYGELQQELKAVRSLQLVRRCLEPGLPLR
jgi:hypothetical protein